MTPEHFWTHVERASSEECWLWSGRLNDRGYGVLDYRKHRNTGAHRVSWALTHGGDLPTAWVLHRCDNPRCVNPSHLFLGDAVTNNRDRAAKGRSADVRGHRSPLAKLTLEQAVEIRRRRLAGESIVSLGREFGIHHGTVSRIAKGQTWTELQA